MPSNEFTRSVSVDFAPRGRVCEWCGNLAERQITAICGSFHNKSGVFCGPCGEKFAENVTKASNMLLPRVRVS